MKPSSLYKRVLKSAIATTGVERSPTCVHTYICVALFDLWIHTNIHKDVLPLCTYIQTHLPTYTYTYIHTCIHAYIHTYTHSYIYTYIHTYIKSSRYAHGYGSAFSYSDTQMMVLTFLTIQKSVVLRPYS